MRQEARIRGHLIYWDESDWRYSDNDRCIDEEGDRNCIKCGLPPTEDGHDPCIANLPGARNACCGHGYPEYAYIQFENGITIRGFNRIESDINRKED